MKKAYSLSDQYKAGSYVYLPTNNWIKHFLKLSECVNKHWHFVDLFLTQVSEQKAQITKMGATDD